MNIDGIPFEVVNLESLSPEVHPGIEGTALWKTVTRGNVRMRIAEYSPGYLVADHAEAHRSSTGTGVKLLIVD